MSDVLLLHPAEQGKTFGSMPPLGMSWIASYLQAKGISTALIDLQVSESSIDSLLQKFTPKVVGIGGTTHTRYESFAIARQVKTLDPAIVTLYGGPHATFTADDTLRHVPEIDIIVRGEGELTSQRIAEHVLRGKSDFEHIPGMSFRRNETVLHNPDVERIRNLDILPFPSRDPEAITRYHLLLDFLKVPAASVMSSRGCPVNCSFCSASAMFGTQLTFRSPANVVDEIEILLKEYSYQGIKFFDSTLTLDRHHVEALCAEIHRRKLTFPWECEIRVNGMTRDLLLAMHNAGCYYVDFGVESASQQVLKSMHKGITLEQVENVFAWTKEFGMYTKVFFTFGHMGETYDDACATVEFMEKYSRFITVAATGIGIRIYPGTDIEQYARSIGCLGSTFSWSQSFVDQNIESLGNDPIVPILIQPKFGWREFRKVEFRVAHFWLKNPDAALRVLWDQIKLGRGRILLRLIYRFLKIQFHQRSTSKSS